jgi:hypothetical protein
MLDDLDHLRHNPRLLQLLFHYAQLGETNRETWQDRLMEMAEVEPPGLVKLHGELIAFQWVEQNTGQFPTCYRITLAGLRAMRAIPAQETEDDDLSLPENQEQQPCGKKEKKAASRNRQRLDHRNHPSVPILSILTEFTLQ